MSEDLFRNRTTVKHGRTGRVLRVTKMSSPTIFGLSSRGHVCLRNPSLCCGEKDHPLMHAFALLILIKGRQLMREFVLLIMLEGRGVSFATSTAGASLHRFELPNAPQRKKPLVITPRILRHIEQSRKGRPQRPPSYGCFSASKGGGVPGLNI